MANLRIVTNNEAVGATITPSSTASSNTIASNLIDQQKTSVWRSNTSSTTSVTANLLIVPPGPTTINFLGLFFTNLTSLATVRVRGWIGAAPTLGGTVDSPTITTTNSTLVFNTTYLSVIPVQTLGKFAWGISPLGENAYSGRTSHARLYISNTVQCSSYTVEIKDINNSKQVEIGNLVIGKYWSPTYNTSYGLSSEYVDTSELIRSENGNLLTIIKPVFHKLEFNLKWLMDSDRAELLRIFRSIGKRTPLFISLFPENSEDYQKELMHQIYGKLSDTYAIDHPMYSIYSSKIQIEEL